MKRILVLLVLVTGCNGKVSAQKNRTEVFGLNYTDNTLKNDSFKGKNSQIDAFLLIPFYQNQTNVIGSKIIYSKGVFSGLNQNLNHTLTATDLSLFWIRSFKRDKLQTFLQYGAFSDFKDINLDDFRLRVTANYSRKYSERLTAGLGMMYNKQFNSNMFIPFVSTDFKITPKWTLSGLLPIKPKLTYLISEKSRWVTEFMGHGETYRLSVKNYNNSVIELTGWTGMSTLDYTFKQHHRLMAGVGYTLSQRIRYYDNPQTLKLKLYNFDLTEKEKPTEDITLSGIRWTAGYNFVF